MEAGLQGSTVEQGEFIKWFEALSLKDIPTVGGKTASLGELYSNLVRLGIEVPYGFAVTTNAYQFFIRENKLDVYIQDLLTNSNLSKVRMGEISKKIQVAFLNAKMPDKLKEAIFKAYQKLIENNVKASVAVRSSATAEDLPEASFAGLHESFLNIRNEDQLIKKCINCFSSLYTERAVSYRQDKSITQTKVSLSICVQRMVRSDLACSGVMFTIDTETGFKDAIVINASYGLGENVVKGIVNPDDFIVFKPMVTTGLSPILQKKLGGKEFKMVYEESNGGDDTLKNITCTDEEKKTFSLSENEILLLSKWGILIEEHYSKLKGIAVPMDIEWAKDGLDHKIYIVQARPETVHSANKSQGVDFFSLKGDGQVLLSGDSVGNLIGQGKVRVIHHQSELVDFKDGEVLVAEKTEPDWEPFMKKSSAIITDRGGRTCHAAIVSRELGIPAVVGTINATEILKNGQDVTVACIFGSQCNVYEGLIPFERKTLSLTELKRPKTKIMMNLANPSMAFKSSLIPNDGVGLLRMEFIINNTIKIHPNALIHFNDLLDQDLKEKIEAQCVGYNSKIDFYIDRLAEGIGMISAAFYPKKVIVRLSDFKSDEYMGLLGGGEFEILEENPMIGLRGASRYYDDSFMEAFALECKAIQKVRDLMGLTNLAVMVPFCRTIHEGKKVLDLMSDHGLKKGSNFLEVFVMCEIPSNAILAEDFAEIFDGFSIGSNDLTQLTLGVDRNSARLSKLFTEDDPAVLALIKMAINGAHKKNIKVGLCGQRPSDDLEFVKFLVENHIDSISLNSDAVIKVTEVVNEVESNLLK